jgi:hypothetical protein
LNVYTAAVDGAGNLFLLDRPYPDKPENQEVRELFAEGGYTQAQVIITYCSFGGVAIDGAGNLFFGGNNAVHEYFAADRYTASKTIGGGFNQAGSLAVDDSGNIFAVDVNNGAVKEILAAGGYTTIKALFSNAYPDYLVLDAADNVYVVDDGPIYELVAAGGYTTVDMVFNPNEADFGIAIDGNGNLFTNNGNNILELRRSQPPSLGFAPTDVDSTSEGPLSVTAQNIGNATLTGSGLAFTDSEDFTRAAGSGTPPDCTSSFSLSPGAECNLGVDFTPAAAGILSGSLVLTDNALNTTAATQSIALSGNGITAGGPVAHVSATTLNYGSVAYPGTATQSLTITNTGGGKLTIGPSFSSLNYKITANTCAAGITTGSCTLQVEFAPTSIGPQPNNLTLATNGPTNPTIALTGTATGVSAVGLNYLLPITSLGFGTIYFPSTSNVQEFAAYNIGVTGPVTVQTSIDGPDYTVIENNCLKPGIKASGFCLISVEFSPLTRGGHYEHLTITPSVGAPSTIELIGTAQGIIP